MAPVQSETFVWETKYLRLAIDAAGVALWSWNIDTNRFNMDDRAYELWDVAKGTEVTFEDLSSHMHPADRDRVRAAFEATRAIMGAYEIDFRIMIGEEIRWVSARGQGDDTGAVGQITFGIFLDVTSRKQAEEAHELLAGEMSHRVKNLLTIASALTAITSRSATSALEMAHDLTHRLGALGRAHDLVRPVAGAKETGALLGDLLTILLAPYDDMGPFGGRIRVSVPRMSVGERSATALALVLHELATNSVKYGALSVATGTLDIAGVVGHDQDAVVIWTERGGPPVTAPEGGGGFGSKLVNRSMSSQLGGSIACEWSAEGVIVTLRIDKDRLAA